MTSTSRLLQILLSVGESFEDFCWEVSDTFCVGEYLQLDSGLAMCKNVLTKDMLVAQFDYVARSIGASYYQQQQGCTFASVNSVRDNGDCFSNLSCNTPLGDLLTQTFFYSIDSGSISISASNSSVLEFVGDRYSAYLVKLDLANITGGSALHFFLVSGFTEGGMWGRLDCFNGGVVATDFSGVGIDSYFGGVVDRLEYALISLDGEFSALAGGNNIDAFGRISKYGERGVGGGLLRLFCNGYSSCSYLSADNVLHGNTNIFDFSLAA
jgi:hypothetical protein